MSFISDNINFIKIELHTAMRDLSDSDKLAKYELKKIDCRKRLKTSYLNCSNKLSFYKEAFQELSFYETDFLLLNLFFEEKANSIFQLLTSNSFNNLNFQNKNSISFKFWDYMKKSNNDEIYKFLQTEFIELLEINERNWRNEKGTNSFIQEYSKWLIESINNSIDENKIIFSYNMFCKLWNSEKLYFENLNTQESLLYYHMNVKFDSINKNNNYINLFAFINIIIENTNDLFLNEKINFPFIETQKNSDKTKRYFEEFNKRIKLSELLCCSFTHKSHSYIFKLMDEFSDEIVLNKLNTELNDKLNDYVFPTHEDVEEIINKIYNIDKVNSYKKDFLRRLYIY